MTRHVMYNQAAMTKQLRSSFLLFVLSLLGLCFCSSLWAAESTATFADHYKRSLEFIQKKDLDAARQSLKEALKIQPDNQSAKLNLAIIAAEKKEIGLAFGLARSLLEINPRNEKAQQLITYLNSTHPPKAIPHQSDFLEELHQSFLVKVDVNSIFLFLALLVFSSGWLWLNYIKRKKEQEAQELEPPRWPWIAIFLSTCGLSFLLISGLKAWDAKVIRGTILKEEVPVLVTPDPQNGIELLKLSEGLEVHIFETQNEYIKVQYPGTPAGWVKKEQVFTHSR